MAYWKGIFGLWRSACTHNGRKRQCIFLHAYLDRKPVELCISVVNINTHISRYCLSCPGRLLIQEQERAIAGRGQIVPHLLEWLPKQADATDAVQEQNCPSHPVDYDVASDVRTVGNVPSSRSAGLDVGPHACG